MEKIIEETINGWWIAYGLFIVFLLKMVPLWLKRIVNEAIDERIDSRNASLKEEIDILKQVDLALTQYRLMRMCERYIEQNYMTIPQNITLENLYNSYKLLGGNGVVERLYKKCKLLEIRKGENND